MSSATALATAVVSPRVGLDGVEDLRVARAAAEVALERRAEVVTARARAAFQEGEHGEQHAGRAEPALHGAVPHERLLERMEPALALEPADGEDRAPSRGGREHEAARHRPAVEEHGARAADALAAAFLDVEDPERVAQDLEQRLAGPDVEVSLTPVDHETPTRARSRRFEWRPGRRGSRDDPGAGRRGLLRGDRSCDGSAQRTAGQH